MQDADAAERLRRAGVPDAVISHAFKHAGRWYLGGLAFVAVWLPLAGAGYWIGWKLWSWLNQIAENNAMRHAKAADALMYRLGFEWSLLIGLFAWLLISLALVGSLSLLSNRSLSGGFITTVSNGDGPKAIDWINRQLIDRVRNETDPERYIRKINLYWLLITAIIGVVLAVISVSTVPRDIQSHSIFTTQSYINSPFLPWFSARVHDWSSATSVATGCSHSDRDNKNTIHYEVTFADGASVDLGRAVPVAGDWLRAVEAIDQEVRKSGATFSPWTWLWHESFHPLCIKAIRAQVSGMALDRVKRLLRLPD